MLGKHLSHFSITAATTDPSYDHWYEKYPVMKERVARINKAFKAVGTIGLHNEAIVLSA